MTRALTGKNASESKQLSVKYLMAAAVLTTALLLIGTWFAPRPAAAESEPTGLTDVVVTIYPEYDDPYELGQPNVLVMLDGRIEGAEPPVTIRFLVPQDAIMYSAGSGPRDRYVGGPPARKRSQIAGWDEISYELQTAYFVVEYYQTIQSLPAKNFSVEFIPVYPVDGVTAVVQQPLESRNFISVPAEVPAAQRQGIDSAGFKTYTYEYNSLEKDQSLSFSLSYTRETLAPSLNMGEESSSSTVPIVIAAVVGCAALGGGLFWLLRKPSRPAARRIRREATAKRRKEPQQPQEGKRSGPKFCTDCGVKLDKPSRFCPECGVKLGDRQGSKHD